MGPKADLLRAAKLFFAGHLMPVIDRRFPLQEAAAAHAHLEQGLQFGKVVLDV